MGKEKSPFGKKKISINKLGEVMEHLIKYNRIIWLSMRKGSQVILREGNVIMGPFPNWKGYIALSHILAFEQDRNKQKEDARAAIKNRPLFIMPEAAAEPRVFSPPGA